MSNTSARAGFGIALEGVSWTGAKSVQREVGNLEVGKTSELADVQTLCLVGVGVGDLDVGQAEFLHIGDLVMVQAGAYLIFVTRATSILV